jgi:hypothetical protein
VGAFGNSDIKLTGPLTLNVGLRYSHENKSLHGSLFRAGGCDVEALTCVHPSPISPPPIPAMAGRIARLEQPFGQGGPAVPARPRYADLCLLGAQLPFGRV